MRHALLAALLLAGAVHASAQTEPPADPPAPRPFSFDISGGGVVPLGEAGDASGPGWNVGVSAGVAVRGRFSIRALYLYSRFAAKEIQVPVEVDGPQPLSLASLRGKVQSHAGFFDLVAGWPSAGGRRTFYVMAGPLVAGRRVSITGSGPTAAAFDACLPQWLQCSATTVSLDRALGIRRAASVGASVGAGVSFDVGLAARLVIEARYTYLDGPWFTDVNGTRQSASATYVPLSIGLRF